MGKAVEVQGEDTEISCHLLPYIQETCPTFLCARRLLYPPSPPRTWKTIISEWIEPGTLEYMAKGAIVRWPWGFFWGPVPYTFCSCLMAVASGFSSHLTSPLSWRQLCHAPAKEVLGPAPCVPPCPMPCPYIFCPRGDFKSWLQLATAIHPLALCVHCP